MATRGRNRSSVEERIELRASETESDSVEFRRQFDPSARERRRRNEGTRGMGWSAMMGWSKWTDFHVYVALRKGSGSSSRLGLQYLAFAGSRGCVDHTPAFRHLFPSTLNLISTVQQHRYRTIHSTFYTLLDSDQLDPTIRLQNGSVTQSSPNHNCDFFVGCQYPALLRPQKGKPHPHRPVSSLRILLFSCL